MTVILLIDVFPVDFQTFFCLYCQSVVFVIRLTALFDQMNRTEGWKVPKTHALKLRFEKWPEKWIGHEMKIEFYMWSKRKIKPHYVHFKVIYRLDPDQFR